MREFNKVNKIFIKSNNSTMKIFNRYLYCLIPFILQIIIYNLIWGSRLLVLNFIRNILVSIVFGLVTGCVCDLIQKKKNIKDLFFRDHVLIITIIISLFSLNSGIIITGIASSIAVIFRKFLKNTTISSSLYGIFIILLLSLITKEIETPLEYLKGLSNVDSYDNIIGYSGGMVSCLLGLKYYLSPILSIVVFLYLFFKKSIKYNIVISYLLTFSFVMLIFGIFNGMNVWFLLFQLCAGDILFLTIFCLTDYPNTPIIYEGQVIYGIVLGLISAILRFVLPTLSIVVAMMLGVLFISKVIDKISIKLKYEKKFYYLVLGISFFVVILTSVILNIIY